ncbi:MAG: hypothetical protein WC215_00125, partial [Bacilli bacterium]
MSFTLKYQGQEKTFERKVALQNLVDDPDKLHVCAKVNNRIRELTYEVYYDAEVEFLTVKDTDAIPIYETSLRYLVAMAFKRAYPELDVRFSYNVSRSIFVQILNDSRHSDMAMVRRIEEEMNKIVASDYPLHRMIVTKEDARQVYLDKDLKDKLELLKYRPEKTVHLYDCDGYLNYMYGRMVPSTGYLKMFKLRLYSPGVIVQYPRAEAGGDIPKFEDAPTFGKTLKASHAWGKIAGADSVSGINEHIKKDGVVDFINMCETRHNRMLIEIGDMIEEDIDTIRLICIAGPSSSGKTTFSNRLR